MQYSVLRRTEKYIDKLEKREAISRIDQTILRNLTQRETKVRELLKVFADKFMELKEEYENEPDY